MQVSKSINAESFCTFGHVHTHCYVLEAFNIHFGTVRMMKIGNWLDFPFFPYYFHILFLFVIKKELPGVWYFNPVTQSTFGHQPEVGLVWCLVWVWLCLAKLHKSLNDCFFFLKIILSWPGLNLPNVSPSHYSFSLCDSGDLRLAHHIWPRCTQL